MPPIRRLRLTGTPFEMGYQHGCAYASAIRALAEERIALCSNPTWTGVVVSRSQVMALAQRCIPIHQDYAPEEMIYLEGMAYATGLGIAELIILNGFTDFVDALYAEYSIQRQPATHGNDCTAFMVGKRQTRNGRALFGQTWDMHASATPHVILIEGIPHGKPRYIAFSLTGCVGMIGMNETGICVGINNLLGDDGRVGVTWPFVCMQALTQIELRAARDCILRAPLAGAHNYLIMDADGNGYNIEATTTTRHIESLDENPLIHTNACLHPVTQQSQRALTPQLIYDSQTRFRRAWSYIQKEAITPDDLMQLTRDRNDGPYSVCSISEPPFYSETCGAVIMEPATRRFWAVWGLPTENDYELVTL